MPSLQEITPTKNTLRLPFETPHPTAQDVLPVNPKLLEDPKYPISLREELARYATFLAANPDHEVRIKGLHDSMRGTTQADVNQLEGVVAVPVAAHQEGRSYGNLLGEVVLSGGVAPSMLEQVGLLNIPDKQHAANPDTSEGQKVRETIDSIDAFRARHGTDGMAVRSIPVAYDAEPFSIGTARADMWEAIAYDLLQRGREEDIFVLALDADTRQLSPGFSQKMVDRWRETGAPIVAARFQYSLVPEEGQLAAPNVNRVLRYLMMCNTLRDNGLKNAYPSDGSMGMSMAAYLAYGGYKRSVKVGESLDFADRIRRIVGGSASGTRESAKPYIADCAEAVAYSDPRRLVAAMARGYAPNLAWRALDFGSDDALRTHVDIRAAERNAADKFDTFCRSVIAAYVGRALGLSESLTATLHELVVSKVTGSDGNGGVWGMA